MKELGYRTILMVPLLREGVAIGAIMIRRTEVRPFTDKQLELVRTFAAQAVIAIENVRLFRELETRNRDLTETLEQQTATSDILRVISSSPTDVQPVFDTIAQNARRLCDAEFCAVFRYDGRLLHFVAHDGVTAEGVEAWNRLFPVAPGRGSGAGRAVLSGAVEQVPDVAADPEYSFGELARIVTFRSLVAVPILRDGHPIGAITVNRSQTGVLPTRQIDLLKTFADQAVIAIENVRLFKELEVRNRDLTETLEQQTATGEILRVISSSPDRRPARVRHDRAQRAPAVRRPVARGHPLRRHAHRRGVAPQPDRPGRDRWRSSERQCPRAPEPRTGRPTGRSSSGAWSTSGRAGGARLPVPGHGPGAGYRSMLAVPMIREGAGRSARSRSRARRPGRSRSARSSSLKTFATRRSSPSRTSGCSRSWRPATATSPRPSSSRRRPARSCASSPARPTDVQPVFDTIARSAHAALRRASAAPSTRFDGTPASARRRTTA